MSVSRTKKVSSQTSREKTARKKSALAKKRTTPRRSSMTPTPPTSPKNGKLLAKEAFQAVKPRPDGDPRVPSSIEQIPWPARQLQQLSDLIMHPRSAAIIGPPGTCKSSAIRFLTKTLDADSLWIDANETGGVLDFDAVKGFIFGVSMEDKPKILVIDEADSCSFATLEKFRGQMMDQGTVIIFIANRDDRFSDAIRSRCETILLGDIGQHELIEAQVERAITIVETFGLSKIFTRDIVRAILQQNPADMRKGMLALTTWIKRAETGNPPTIEDFSPEVSNVAAAPSIVWTKTGLQRETADLLKKLVEVFQRHLVITEHQALVLALFVLHAYAHDAAYFSPILSVVSPEPECGKSSALNLLRMLIAGAEMYSDVSQAALYEAAASGTPLILDETDRYLKGNSSLIQILNAGVERGSTVRRFGKKYSVWCPKILARIGLIPTESLASRCIDILLRRKGPSEHRERVTSDLSDMLKPFRERCGNWSTGAIPVLKGAKPEIAGLSNRAVDRWTCLIAIGDLAGAAFGKAARVAMTNFEGSRYIEESLPRELSNDICTILAQRREKVFFSVDLLAYLAAMPGSQWARRLSNSQQALARHLASFGLRPKNYRNNGRQAKGYSHLDLQSLCEKKNP